MEKAAAASVGLTKNCLFLSYAAAAPCVEEELDLSLKMSMV
jgi:hypothetical protein